MMNGFWLIFRLEYRKKVRQRGFLITTLGIPLMLLLVMGISILAVIDPGGSRVVGYLDEGGLIPAQGAQNSPNHAVTFCAYAALESARMDLEAGILRAYYIIPPNYPETGHLDVVYSKRPPNETIQAAFDRLLRVGLAARIAGNVNPQMVERPEITVRSADGSREVGQGGFTSLILPFVASFVLVFAVMMTGGSLLMVVAEEKENRTIEILVTSLTPEQLIGGKALALMSVCLTQMALWFAAAGIALGIGGRFFEPLRQIYVPWELLGLTGLFFLPAYALIAAIMTAIGGAAGDMRQSQQVGGLLNLIFLLPLFLASQILQSPNHPLAVALTLFPPTAFSTVLLRWSLGSVPFWQLLVSWSLLVISSLLTVLLAARIFRLGMLRYGKGLDLPAAVAGMFRRAASRK